VKAPRQLSVGWQALTVELADPRSPVRQFLDSRLTAGLREAQRSYRSRPAVLAVPPAPAADANPGTVGTAADWPSSLPATPG
jgi:hypothetical protein